MGTYLVVVNVTGVVSTRLWQYMLVNVLGYLNLVNELGWVWDSGCMVMVNMCGVWV